MLGFPVASNFESAANELTARFTTFCNRPTADAGRQLNLDIHTFLLTHMHVDCDAVVRLKLLDAGVITALWLDSSISAADVDLPTYCEHLSALSF